MRICKYIPKHNLFILYDVTFIEVCMADRLALNELICSTLEKTSSLVPSFLQWPIVLWVGWLSLELFLSYLECLLVYPWYAHIPTDL